MAAVVGDLEIVEPVVEQRIRLAANHEARQRIGLARELDVDLLQMVEIQVAIPARPDEVADVEIALLRHEVRQQRV